MLSMEDMAAHREMESEVDNMFLDVFTEYSNDAYQHGKKEVMAVQGGIDHLTGRECDSGSGIDFQAGNPLHPVDRFLIEDTAVASVTLAG